MSLLKKFLSHGEQEYTHKKLGLERIREILKVLDHPEESFESVLIAGTNGKGSVGRLLESVLLETGIPVGLYASPHLSRFNERIRVGGEEVQDTELESVLEEILEKGLLSPDGTMPIPSGDTLTWFEKTTMLAFEIFRRRKVKLALLEVGMGGRLDATNVVNPMVSVITSIAKDHTEALGDSLFEIAKEKLGVMRPNKPLVLGLMDPNVRNFLNKAARMQEAKPITPSLPQGTTEAFSYGPFHQLQLGISGQYQLKNAATAIETLVALKREGFEISNQDIRRGFAKVEFPGRMEWVPGEPKVLLDGAHNPEALQALADYLKVNLWDQKISLVIGMVGKKDLQESLRALSPLNADFFFTELDSPRSVSLSQWEVYAKMLGREGKYIQDPMEAFHQAKLNSGHSGLVVVTGSLYLVGQIRDGIIF